jgi:hypothetical protein
VKFTIAKRIKENMTKGFKAALFLNHPDLPATDSPEQVFTRHHDKNTDYIYTFMYL